MFILGCLLSRDLQTLDKSDPVPRTGGQTVPGRLGDDGSPAGSCRVMENFFSLTPPSPSLYSETTEIPSGHTSTALKVLLASRTLRALSFPLLLWGSPQSGVPLLAQAPGGDRSGLCPGDHALIYPWKPSGWQCLPWLHCAVKSLLHTQRARVYTHAESPG